MFGRGRLAGFAVVHAGPGEAVTAEVGVPDRALADWDPDAHAFVVPDEEVTLRAGGLTTRRPTR